MTEELTNNEVKTEQKEECKCCKCLKKFVIITSSVFVGTTLAILVSASLIKPATPPCPPPMFNNGPRMERPMEFGAPEMKIPHRGHKIHNDQQAPERNLPPKDIR